MSGSKPWVYHPHAVVVRSFDPGSDLASRLAVALGEFHQTGVVFHGGQAREMLDHSSVHRCEGAWGAMIVDGRRSRFQQRGHVEFPALRLMLLEADVVVVAGEVDDRSPVVLELDGSAAGWEAVPDEVRSRSIACVGGRPSVVPPGGLAWFASDDLDGLVEHLRDHLERAVRGRALWGVLETDASPAEPDVASIAHRLRASCGRLAVRGARAKEWERIGAVAFEPGGHGAWGKLGALLSLWDFDPTSAFLQVEQSAGSALDLDRLIDGRDPWRFATAFRETQSHLPRLGAVVWEPKSRSKILQALAAGLTCPQRVLVQSRTQLLECSV